MITQIKTQVLVLGSGPGGYSAAFRCSDLGLTTTIVERYPKLGGVCLNIGCIPSKTLLNIAKLIKTHKNLNKYGILSKPAYNIDLDINKMRLWKDNIINKLSRGLDAMSKARNIKIIHGFGKFINSNTLEVSNHQNNINIIFDQAIIATGSHPISLSSLPNDQRIWNSSDALSLELIPKKLLIIGSGAIGLEMATIYHSLGSKVDLVEKYNQIIPFLDKEIVNLFLNNLSKEINFLTNTKINEAQITKDGVYVVMENNINTHLKYTNLYDAVLVAIGRSPNSYNLNLDKIGINTNEYGFIPTDKQMRTNTSHIFAIGDIIGHPMLAHKSAHEGHIAAEVIAGKKYYFDSKAIPSIIYTDPEIAWVGYTEKEAKDKNINYDTATFPWNALGKAISSDCTKGITKLIFDKKTNRIIGGVVLGSHASEIIGEIALAIEMGCDVEDITLTIHAHPTLYESIALAASVYNGSITELPPIPITTKNP